jgi:hypothetical protein
MSSLSSKVKIFDNLKQFSKTLLIHHWDTDGICSAALLINFLKNLDNSIFITNRSGQLGVYWLDDKEIDEITSNNYSAIAIVDYNIPALYIKKLQDRAHCPILFFDHHKQVKIPNIFHYNPLLGGASEDEFPSTSWVITHFLGRSIDFLALLGAVGDRETRVKECPRVWQKLNTWSQRYGIPFEDFLLMARLLDTNYIIGNTKEVEAAVPFVASNFNNPTAILNNKKWQENLQLIDQEIETQLKKPNVYEDRWLLAKHICTKYNIISTVTRKLVWEDGCHIALVMNKRGPSGYSQIYVRNNLGLDFTGIIKAAKREGFSVGGKQDVVGIICPKAKAENFFNYLLEQLRKSVANKRGLVTNKPV